MSSPIIVEFSGLTRNLTGLLASLVVAGERLAEFVLDALTMRNGRL